MSNIDCVVGFKQAKMLVAEADFIPDPENTLTSSSIHCQQCKISPKTYSLVDQVRNKVTPVRYYLMANDQILCNRCCSDSIVPTPKTEKKSLTMEYMQLIAIRAHDFL